MAGERYDYCKIFVSRTDEASATESLAALFRGQFRRHSMEVDDVVIDVRTNPDGLDVVEVGDDFVRWPVLVEVEPVEEAGPAMVDAVGRILTAFWDGGRPAVAACDFEDELPWGGGIQRLSELD